MKTKREREEYFNNQLNWETAEETTFTRTLKLRYKGNIWIKIQTREYAFSHYDFQLNKHVNAVKWHDKGVYTINDLHEALVSTCKTEVIEEMTDLDKKRPDQASAPAIPSVMEVPRAKS